MQRLESGPLGIAETAGDACGSPVLTSYHQEKEAHQASGVAR